MPTTPPTMKIRVSLLVEVDREAWIQTYGDEPSFIRQSVKNYVEGSISESAAANEGAITGVTLS